MTPIVLYALLVPIGVIGSGYGGGGYGADSKVGTYTSGTGYKRSESDASGYSNSGYDRGSVDGGSGYYSEKAYDYQGPETYRDTGYTEGATADKYYASSDKRAHNGHAHQNAYTAAQPSYYAAKPAYYPTKPTAYSVKPAYRAPYAGYGNAKVIHARPSVGYGTRRGCGRARSYGGRHRYRGGYHKGGYH